MNKMDEEEFKIFDFALDKLTEEATKVLSDFNCSMRDDTDDFTWDEDQTDKTEYFKSRTREYIIRWSTKSNFFRISFAPCYGTVSINIGTGERKLDIGFGAKNKDIKIKIMKLYHKIKAYQDIEVPRQDREDFINKMVKVFPDMFDKLILGDEDGEEEES